MAVVGASAREDSFGLWTLRNAANPEFTGTVFAVNPNHDEIDGHACFPNLSEIPEPIDHAVISIANDRLEEQIGEAIKAGVGAATIFASCYLEGDTGEPKLKQRVTDMAREAGPEDLRRQLHGRGEPDIRHARDLVDDERMAGSRRRRPSSPIPASPS